MLIGQGLDAETDNSNAARAMQHLRIDR